MCRDHVDRTSLLICSVVWYLVSSTTLTEGKRNTASFVSTAFAQLSKQQQRQSGSSLYRSRELQRRIAFIISAQSDPSSGSEGRKNVPIDKTYETNSYNKDVIIDQEGAMLSFFNCREEWLPLFRSVAGNDLPKDTISLLNSIAVTATTPSSLNDSVSDNCETTNVPWKQYDAIPNDEGHRTIIARFLDSMQESLLAIPVLEDAPYMGSSGEDDLGDDDENDIQFVEEGRRLLALNRFHVLSSNSNNTNDNTNGMNIDGSIGSIESADELFTRCWSEIFVLSQEGTVNSGSLLLLPPQYDSAYVCRFLDMNIIQPLRWLGVHNDYEISTFQRDSAVIRMIYKLNAIPTKSSYSEEDGFAANN